MQESGENLNIFTTENGLCDYSFHVHLWTEKTNQCYQTFIFEDVIMEIYEGWEKELIKDKITICIREYPTFGYIIYFVRLVIYSQALIHESMINRNASK